MGLEKFSVFGYEIKKYENVDVNYWAICLLI